jgi:hypothetical protein
MIGIDGFDHMLGRRKGHTTKYSHLSISLFSPSAFLSQSITTP